MTVPDLIQLYAPLAGLLALAFWTGVLSQKVDSLTERLAKVESNSDGDMTTVDRLARLETKIEIAAGSIEKLTRGMDGVQRQLGNLMMKPGSGSEFHHG